MTLFNHYIIANEDVTAFLKILMKVPCFINKSTAKF